MIGGALAARAGKGLWSLVNQGITAPIWLVAAIGLWLWFDQGSAVRQAVNAATQELVAGARIAALEAERNALLTLNADEAGRAAALERANDRFAEQMAAAQVNLENANDQIAELLARPVASDCTADSGFVDRLRHN